MAIEKTPRLGLTKYTSGSDLHPNRTEFNALQDLLESLVAISAQGTLAARPPAGVKNRFYWATDTARAYFDDGKQWLDVNPNGGGGAGQAVVVAGAAAEGTSARAARADHTHNLPLAAANINGAMAAVDKKKLDAATAAATAYTIALRNENGQIMVGTPTVATHAAHKEYVDGQINTRATKAHTHNADDVNAGVLDAARLPAATRSVQGALSAADKTKLDNATSGTTGGTLVQRADNGQFQVPDPTAETHAVNLRHVNAVAEQRVEYKGELGTGSLNSVTLRGVYSQSQGGPVTAANGYPIDGAAGTLVVLPFGPGVDAAYVTQEWTQWSPERRWFRSTNNRGTTWRSWVEQANTSTATSAADGLMSKADKGKLDNATAANTGGTLVQRASNGRVNLSSISVGTAPTVADDATRKDYVDGQINTRAAKEHTHALSDIVLHSLGQAQNIDEVLTPGLYHQGGNVYATLELNYPVALAGLLEVHASATAFIYQRYTSYGASSRTFTRARYSNSWGPWKEFSTTDHKHNGSDITSGTISPDRIANATASLDGLMPKADKSKLDAATRWNTKGTIVMRDADGNFSSFPPKVSDDVANKGYVDAEVAKKANASHSHGAGDLPDATQSAPGIMSAADKKKLDTASSAATANSLVMLDSAGRTRVTNPAVAADAANKGYVDAEVAKRALASHSHGAGDLPNATATAPGIMSAADKKLLDGATSGATGGTLVQRASNGQFSLPDPSSATHAANKQYVDAEISSAIATRAASSHNHSGANITSGTINPARIANSTQTVDGLMSAEDKKKLDIASAAAWAERLVLRDDGGRASFKTPTSNEHAANKAYVDAQVKPLADEAVEHFISTNRIAGAASKPAGVPWKHFAGAVLVTTGAGGATRTAANATDANGIGGIWFGYLDVPKFTGIAGLQMTTKSSEVGYTSTIAAMDVTTTRIKFRAAHMPAVAGSTVAWNWGNILVYLDIWGW